MPNTFGKGAKEHQKVVVVGLSKTGTSSLKVMLQELGYSVCGPKKALLAEVRGGNVAAIDATVEEYDAFEDWPWPLVYKEIHRKYGENARFILTVRKDADTWYRSIESHGYRTGVFNSMKNAYGYYRPFGRKDQFHKIYHDHNSEVTSYFAHSPHLLTQICLESDEGWEKLCDFLGHAAPEKSVPHRNKTSAESKRLRRALNSLIAPIYARLPVR
ncbi:MAG: sulfotransferase family protein [Pseudomonadota bacterium]